MRISDWSSDVCSSDLFAGIGVGLDVVRPVRPVPAELAAAQQCADTRGHGLYRDLADDFPERRLRRDHAEHGENDRAGRDTQTEGDGRIAEILPPAPCALETHMTPQQDQTQGRAPCR